jgi:hypothetical protein
VAIGMVPERVEMHAELTPMIERHLDRVVAAAISRLGEWGFRVDTEGGRGA